MLQELLDVLSSQFCRYHGASNPATGSVVLDAVANPDNKYNFVYIEPPPPDVSSRVREDGTVMDGEIPEPEQEVQDEHAAQGSDNDDDDWQAAAERHDSERRQQQQSEELPKTEPCQLPPTSRTLPYMSPKFLFLRPGLVSFAPRSSASSTATTFSLSNTYSSSRYPSAIRSTSSTRFA